MKTALHSIRSNRGAGPLSRWGLGLAFVVALACGLNSSSAGQAGGKGTVVTLGPLKSTTPGDWEARKPANKFRAYQFNVGASELVISFFGEGVGGNPNDNVKRWKDQFVPPEGKTIDDVSNVQKFKVGPATLTYLDVRGTYLYKNPPFDPNAKTERKADYRLLSAQFDCAGGPYFVRLTGPVKSVEQNKKSFDDWLKNFK